MDYHHQHRQYQDDNNQYEYRFEYSLASYCISGSGQSVKQLNLIERNIVDDDMELEQQLQLTGQDEQRMLRRSSQLISFRCFINSQTQNLIKTIFTHYISLYTPLAMRLLKISQLIFPNLNLTTSTFITRCQSNLHYHREKLVQKIKDITKIFHNQKDTFMKYLALCVSAAVFKILTLEDGEMEVDFQSVFHTVNWELIGTHSTSQFLKKLLSETFNPVNFHRYLMNQQPPKVRSFLKPGVGVSNKSQLGRSVQNHNANNALGAAINSSVRNIQLFKTEKYIKVNEKSNMSFSKRLIKQDQINKENLPIVLNDTKSKFEKKVFINKRQQVSNSQIAQLELELFNSNKKDMDFKKDRVALIQNQSKAKTTKRPFADYLSSTKKPTFASYLQQKRLQFEF